MHAKGMLGEEGEHMMEMEGADEEKESSGKPDIAKARKHLMMALQCLMGESADDATDY